MAKKPSGFVLSRRHVLAGAAIGAIAAVTAFPTLAAVGRTVGTFDVSSAGSAAYSIPIFSPPGPRGIQPQIALVYNSNGGVGYLGRSWSLSGLSSVYHCAMTLAQDGNAKAVSASPGSTDGHCLDGNRLRYQSGPWGYYSGAWNFSGSVWATELADFSRITTNGTQNAGPQSWIVDRKNGLTYTYGGTSDSRIVPYANRPVSQWLVSEIKDRHGNKIKFTWKTPDGTTVGMTHPVKIEWTQTSAGSGTYLYSMDFNYGAAANAPASTYTGYVADTLKKESDLLTSITVSASGVVVRKYVLDYETSPTTGAKRLIEITECADSAASDCLSSTMITYQDSTPGYNTTTPALSVNGNFDWANGSHDYNGDGIKDLTYSVSGSIYVRMGSSSSGYGSEISTGLTSLKAGKLLGTAADQLLGASGGTWYVYYWNGSSFSSVSTGITTAASSANVTVGDADADGRDDLIYVTELTTGTEFDPAFTHPVAKVAVRRNESPGSYPSFGSPVVTEYTDYADHYYPVSDYNVPPGFTMEATFYDFSIVSSGDINGDGRTDHSVEYGIDWCLYYYGSPYWCGGDVGAGLISFFGSSVWMGFYDYNTYSPWNFGAKATQIDFNKDGCRDYELPYGGALEPVFSSCSPLSMGTQFDNATLGGGTSFYVGGADWNGDGLKDFILTDYSTLYVRALHGNEGVGTLTDLGIPVIGDCLLVTTDGNGDGREDIGCVRPGYSLTIYYNNTDVIPDLAYQIKDGFDVTHNISYASIADGPHTPYTNASHPYRSVTGEHIVVSSVETTDGSGGTYTTTYEYFGGAQHLERRTFQGFEKIETVDSRNSVKHVRHFSQEFPYTGMIIEESLYQGSGIQVSSRTVAPDKHVLDGSVNNQRYFPYASSITEDAYEVGGTRNGDWITHTEISNTFDTSGNLTASTRAVTDKDGSSPYYAHTWTQASSATFSPNATYWCLGLPTTSSTTSSTTVSGETSITVDKTFYPDYVNCRMDGESVGSGNRQVDTAYGYDAFGNVDEVSVTGRHPGGSNMSTRTTHTTWGSANGAAPGTGQFPISETNAEGETTTRAFDSTFGSLVTQTDPNGIVVTSNEYDAFGRLTRGVRADGTATRLTYAACATYGCENGDPGSVVTGINKMIVIASERNTSDSQFRDSWTYLDQFDRPIVQKTLTMAGGYSRSGIQYDASGRVHRQTAPCDASSCSVYWTTNTYDLLGRVLTQSRPRSQSAPTPVTTTHAYAGRSYSVTDPRGKISTKILDVNGWMRRSTDHDGYYQSFSYDGAGSLKAVTDSLSNTLFTASYTYGAQAFQDATTSNMDLGTWTYSRNSLGELVGWEDAKGQDFSQTFDDASRLLTRTDHAESVTTTWTWGISAGAYNIGRLAGVSMPGYSESFNYDSKGRPSTRTITTDQTYDIDYAYTNQGLLDTLTYPTSTSPTRVKVKYGYAYGILTSVTDWTSGSAGTVYWTANAQNVRGQTTQETLGNGVVTSRNFDAVTGWLNSIQSGPSGGNPMGLQNLGYAYDEAGNVTQRQENSLGLTENFCHDNLYRLTKVELGSVPSPTCGSPSQTFAYDLMGNITAQWDPVNGTRNYAYHGTKKHAMTGFGSDSYSYDANGNMITRAGSTITWSSFNYPTGLSTGSESTVFHYGPDRQYYLQEYSGPGGNEDTYYVGGILEKVIAGGDIDWRHYIKAEGQTVAIVSRKWSGANTVNYPLEDNQGSGSHLTNSSGAGVARQSYAAFGLPRDGSDWDGAVPSGDQTALDGISRRGYTGHSMLGAMGLIHMNGRVQDAITGRFLSPDPNVPHPGFTQSYNRYTYVYNNPLTYIDPTGFCTDKEIEDNPEKCLLDGVDIEAYGCTISTPEHCSPLGLWRLRQDFLRACRFVLMEPCDGAPPPTPLDSVYEEISGSATTSAISTISRTTTPTRPKQLMLPQGHDYIEANPVCRRPLVDGEWRDLLGRFGVPNGYTRGEPQGGSGHHVVTAIGLPGGIIRSTYSEDGKSVTNVTTPIHVFAGTIDRTGVNLRTGAYMITHGYGTAAPGIDPTLSMWPTLLGRFRDLGNQYLGPMIFESLDNAAARYASTHFEGC